MEVKEPKKESFEKEFGRHFEEVTPKERKRFLEE